MTPPPCSEMSHVIVVAAHLLHRRRRPHLSSVDRPVDARTHRFLATESIMQHISTAKHLDFTSAALQHLNQGAFSHQGRGERCCSAVEKTLPLDTRYFVLCHHTALIICFYFSVFHLGRTDRGLLNLVCISRSCS